MGCCTIPGGMAELPSYKINMKELSNDFAKEFINDSKLHENPLNFHIKLYSFRGISLAYVILYTLSSLTENRKILTLMLYSELVHSIHLLLPW